MQSFRDEIPGLWQIPPGSLLPQPREKEHPKGQVAAAALADALHDGQHPSCSREAAGQGTSQQEAGKHDAELSLAG